MARTRLYTLIYIALMVLAIGKVVFFELFGYWTAMGLTFLSAVAKTTLIAAYFQHLRWEPRSLTFLMLMGLFGVFLLTVAATFSVFPGV